METITRKNTSFRLRTDLLERLRHNAAIANRTLNNYVESVLLDVVYHEPNEVTKAAIEEVMSGRNPGKVYTNVDEKAFWDLFLPRILGIKGESNE